MRKSFPLSIAYAAILALFVSIAGLSVLRAEDGVFEPLSIVTAGGTRDFQVEVMRTEDEQRRGMMFRRSLDPDKGNPPHD